MPPPQITVTAPADGQTVSGMTTVRTAAVSSIGVSTVRFLVDGAPVTTLNAYPYNFPWSTLALANGPHQISITATDDFGNVGTRNLAVNVQNHETPGREILPPGPVTGFRTAVVTSSQIVFQWNPCDDALGIASYAVYRDGVPIGSAASPPDNTPPSYTDTALSPGKVYSYQVVAINTRDRRSAMSSPLAITTKAQDGKVLRVGPGGICHAVRGPDGGGALRHGGNRRRRKRHV